ncbi:MAG: hypothetical protein LW709_04970 [Oxalobacteraceae bacterium]|nr:hypothetical protein [Oxalobacteraceae bacterium]
MPNGETYDPDKHGSHKVGGAELVPGAPGYDFDKALPWLKEIAASDRQLSSYLTGRGIELAPASPQTQPVEEAPMLIADPALAAELEAINQAIEPKSAGADVRQQTAKLLQEKIDRAPDQSQLDYWSGIFGLDSQITPDEVERLSLAVSIARDAAALSETALAKQAQLATTEVDIEALALEDDTELVSQNASNLSSTEAPEDQQAAVIPTPVIQVPVVQAPVADPIVAEVAEQSAAVSAGEPVAVADAPAEQPTISQVAEESLALASESALEASLLSAQSNLIMTSAQYLNQQISLNQAQSLTEES